jgi:hypothetical protein
VLIISATGFDCCWNIKKHFVNNRTFLKFLVLVLLGFSALSASAAEVDVVVRTGQAAEDVSGWTYNGLFNDNASPAVALPAPMFAGELVTFFSSLRQGTSIPTTDKGIWLVDQNNNGRVVARQNQAASGMSPSTQYETLLSILGDVSGKIIFTSNITGPDVTPALNDSGIWIADESSSELMVRRGDLAPETVVFPGEPPRGSFNSFLELAFADGSVGVDSIIKASVRSLPGQNPPLPGTTGFWAHPENGGEMDMVMWSYGIPPGLEGQDVGIVTAYGVFGRSGRGLYTGTLGGLGIVSQTINGVIVSNDGFVYRSGPGYETLAARTLSPAPGTPDGVVFRSLPGFTNLPAVGRSGLGVFWGMLAGPGVNSGTWSGLWKTTNEGTSLLVRGGMPAAAVGAGVVLTGITANSSNGTLYVTDNDDVYFATNLGGQGVNLGNSTAIYKITANGTHELIVRAGTVHPDIPDGLTLVRTMLPRVMKATGNDHVMFTSQLQGAGVTTSNDDVLLRHTNAHGLEIVAREGQVIDGYILKSFVDNGANLQVTDNYYAVVPATFVSESNPGGTPRTGILGISPDGQAHFIAATNFPLPLTDGTTPTLLGYRLAPKEALNSAGQVVFSAQFSASPRDEAVLVAQIGSDVPPACVADFDQNGSVQVPDIFAFLSAWFGGSSTADMDGNGQLQVPDIFAFLSLWFAGC